VEDHTGGGLEVVLVVAVEIAVEVVYFGAQREAGIEAVVDTPAPGDRKCRAIAGCRLRLQVRPADDHMPQGSKRARRPPMRKPPPPPKYFT